MFQIMIHPISNIEKYNPKKHRPHKQEYDGKSTIPPMRLDHKGLIINIYA